MMQTRTHCHPFVAAGMLALILLAGLISCQQAKESPPQESKPQEPKPQVSEANNAPVYLNECGTPVIAYLSHGSKQLWVLKANRDEVAHHFGVKEGISASQWTIETPKEGKLDVAIIDVVGKIPPGIMSKAKGDMVIHNKSQCNTDGSQTAVSCTNFTTGGSYEITMKVKSYKTCGAAESGVCSESDEVVATQKSYSRPNCQGDASTNDIHVDTCSSK